MRSQKLEIPIKAGTRFAEFVNTACILDIAFCFFAPKLPILENHWNALFVNNKQCSCKTLFLWLYGKACIMSFVVATQLSTFSTL